MCGGGEGGELLSCDGETRDVEIIWKAQVWVAAQRSELLQKLCEGMHWTHLAQEADCSKHGLEPSVSVKFGVFPDQLKSLGF